MPILVVVALVAAAVGAYFVFFTGDEEGGPEDLVADYFDAYVARDCDAVVDLLAIGDTPRAEALGICESYVAEVDGGDTEILALLPAELISTEVVSESDDSATVEAEFRTEGGDTRSVELPVVVEDGDWKLDPAGSIYLGGPGPGDLGSDSEPSSGSDSGSGSGSGSDADSESGDADPGAGGGGSDEPVGELTEPPLDDPEALENGTLATLAEACSQGDMAACDELWLTTDVGGALEAYAETCGGLAPEGGLGNDCDDTFG